MHKCQYHLSTRVHLCLINQKPLTKANKDLNSLVWPNVAEMTVNYLLLGKIYWLVEANQCEGRFVKTKV